MRFLEELLKASDIEKQGHSQGCWTHSVLDRNGGHLVGSRRPWTERKVAVHENKVQLVETLRRVVEMQLYFMAKKTDVHIAIMFAVMSSSNFAVGYAKKKLLPI